MLFFFVLAAPYRHVSGEHTHPNQANANFPFFHSMNLAMKRKLWKMQHDIGEGHMARKKWFVFIDTDTFVEWDNLLGLLEHFDAAKKFYMGSPVWLPGLQFAHGGSAYILSYGALKALNKPSLHDQAGPRYSQFGHNVTALCCGDEALARALKPKGVKLKGYWPMFNGEIPATIPFGRDHWCEPVISLHHIGGEDMESLWKWVEDWKVKTLNMVYISIFDNAYPRFSMRRRLQGDFANRYSIHFCSKTCSTTSLLKSLVCVRIGTILTTIGRSTPRITQRPLLQPSNIAS